jgi:hypothetical protein
MASIEIRSFRNEDNSVSMVIVVPARRNGEPNFGAIARLNRELLATNPNAFDPREEQAADAIAPYEEQHHATEAPMPPAVEELIARSEDDDGPDGLKAGEAFREHADGAL